MYNKKELEQLLAGFNKKTPLSELKVQLGRPALGIASKIKELSKKYPDKWKPSIAEGYLREASQQYHQQYYKRHRVSLNEKSRKYAQQHPEKMRQYSKQYRQRRSRGLYWQSYSSPLEVDKWIDIISQNGGLPKVGYNIGKIKFLNGGLKIGMSGGNVEMSIAANDFEYSITDVATRIGYSPKLDFDHKDDCIVILSKAATKKDAVSTMRFLAAYARLLETQEKVT